VIEIVEKLIEVGALKFGNFVLSSGKKSNIYVDIKHACTNPGLLGLMAKAMKEKIEEAGIEFDKIACVELGGVPLAVALSLETCKPYIIFRKQEKDYGIKTDFIGEIRNNRFVVVEDVTTTGSSALSVVKRVGEEGGEVKAVIVVVDREEGAKEKFIEHGLKFISILTLGELKARSKP
jgi:orotate phosphoribosyltransferase